MRGGIWLLVLIGLVLLPGFSTDPADARPVELSSR